MTMFTPTRQPGFADDLKGPVEALIRRVAAEAIMPYFRELRGADVTEKTPGELVTIADHKAEEMLVAGLPAILPGSRVIGEEGCAADPSLVSGLGDGLVWVVDPIDGTAHFAAGREPFGVMVALALDGMALAAWIYAPVPDRMHYAVLGQGAFVTVGSGPALRVRASAPRGRPVAGLATQFMPPALRDSLTGKAAAEFELRAIPRCAAEHYPRLCRGENHIALFQRTLAWDHAAGALLLTEAGGRVTRWDGSPYRFHDTGLGILAATSEHAWNRAARALLLDEPLLHEALHLLPPSEAPMLQDLAAQPLRSAAG